MFHLNSSLKTPLKGKKNLKIERKRNLNLRSKSLIFFSVRTTGPVRRIKIYRGDVRARLVKSGGLTDPIKASKIMMGTRKILILLTMICTEKENISCVLLIHILVLNISCILREKTLKEKKDI